jgi:hypothetical protein
MGFRRALRNVHRVTRHQVGGLVCLDCIALALSFPGNILIGLSGMCALPLAAGRNVSGHSTWR